MTSATHAWCGMARIENVNWQMEAGAYSIVAQLPLLPPVIRYYYDFDDNQRSIRDPGTAKYFAVHADGRVGAKHQCGLLSAWPDTRWELPASCGKAVIRRPALLVCLSSSCGT